MCIFVNVLKEIKYRVKDLKTKIEADLIFKKP